VRFAPLLLLLRLVPCSSLLLTLMRLWVRRGPLLLLSAPSLSALLLLLLPSLLSLVLIVLLLGLFEKSEGLLEVVDDLVGGNHGEEGEEGEEEEGEVESRKGEGWGGEGKRAVRQRECKSLQEVIPRSGRSITSVCCGIEMSGRS
jgi:hypothetical protein